MNAFISDRSRATWALRMVILSVTLAREKDAAGDTGNYARFDWQRAWDWMAFRNGVES